ncbi:MAG TPA: helix-turn-helix domain-containing protein, partial [Rhizomicrobium sp.]|nr:helix-turn-helix domain-containing protein [Rhizomicrobium sp.]
NFTELLYAQLAGALQLAARMIHFPPERRVAARLVMLADESVSTGPLRIAVNQAQLAEMTGLSRKTVNGHLQKFTRANLVDLEYGTIVLRDISRLRKHAQ